MGCVAYWLLTGQPVFSADTPMATMLAHVREDPIPPTARTEIVIPPQFEAIIMSCLAKDPRARPASADELSERLAACAIGDEWNRAAAKSWWELHHASVVRMSADDTGTPAATLVPRD